jgi:galactokinase
MLRVMLAELNSNSCAQSVAVNFRNLFGSEPRIFRAPGRINLIGEHTDYNEGFVMPAAIGLYTWVAIAERTDRVLRVYSERFQQQINLSLDQLAGPPRGNWSDYVRGVAACLEATGTRLCGADIFIHGNIPLGAGLSSSASLEVSVLLALTSCVQVNLSSLDLAKLCRKAEQEYVGARCGIMDQFISVFGARGSALLLDCRSLDYKLVPIPENVCFVACNSMTRHELVFGEYNARRADCETAVQRLLPYLPGIRALRDVGIEELEGNKSALQSSRIYRRCRHVITENQRAVSAGEVLGSSNVHEFGKLMYQSHVSLRDDYEVSCHELDLLVQLASDIPGVYGARMTGGGFGGCTLNLVRAECVEAFKSCITAGYKSATGVTPDVYVCQPVDGAEALHHE